MKNTRNLTRRFTIVNAATSNSLLALVKQYEQAAEDQQVVSTLADQITDLDAEINELEKLDHRTAKQEAKIKSLTKKVEALVKKLEAAEGDCEMSSNQLEYYLNHMRDQMTRHIDNLEWTLNDCK